MGAFTEETMKKASWLVSLAMVFSVLRPAVAAPMFPDVPDMWAKDAVAALAAKGLLEGYPDGTFKGDRAATRYEVALIVARLLAKMEQEHATFATKADLDEVKKLVNQLKEELDALGVRVQNLEDNVSKLDKRVTELERVTFYGSVDVRYVSSHIGSKGNKVGSNILGATASSNLAPGQISTANALIPGGVANYGGTIDRGVGVPMAFGTNGVTGGNALPQGRPIIVREFAENTGTGAGSNPAYTNAVGSTATLTRGGSLFTPLTGTSGTLVGVPGVLPVFEIRTGRPVVNGQGFSGQGILGLRIKLNEDVDAGAEFAAYWSAGDQIVDQFYGVSARRLSNAFAGLAGTAQGLDNSPYTRMNLDNFWFTHKPTGIKVQLGAYGDTNMDSIVYTPEFNPNAYGPKYLDNFGFRLSGSGHLLSKFDWEVFGTNVADGNTVTDVGATPYHPYLWGGDIKWGWKYGDSTADLKFNVMRIWDDTSAGSGASVGLIHNVNGVWTDWANPAGYYVNQLTANGTTNLQSVSGRATSTEKRPIAPGVAAADNSVAVLGNVVGAAGNSASTFGPQSMFTWGMSAGWNHTFNEDFKLGLKGEYSNSSYKPSANSAYNAPTGEAWRFKAAGTLYKNFDVEGEYISVNPYHNPYILQYPQVANLSYSYVRIPSLSWYPELYPVNDKDEYPNNRNGFRVNAKWNPTDAKDGKRKTVLWAEYGSLDQNQTSLQQVRYSPGALVGAGTGGALAASMVPNGYVLGQNPGFIDTVFQGFSPNSFAGFTGNINPATNANTQNGVNEFATALENPRGRQTNWGLGLNYRFDQLNGLGLHVGYKNYQFTRKSALAPSLGGSENTVNLDLSGGMVGLQYPVNERLAVKAGYTWTDVKGHYDPLGTYRNYAMDMNSTGFQTFNTVQTAPFVGFDYDVARNVNFNMSAKFLDNKDRLGTFNTTNFFMNRNPFSWGGVMVSSQLKVSF